MKKMNKRISPKMSLRFRFFAICMAEYIIVVVLSYIIGWTFKKWLDITIEIPIFVWAIVFSVLLGGAITTFVTKTFFDPITKLRKAMNKVANGDFKVTVETHSHVPDIKSIYSDFNSMVKELGATETLQTDFISSVSHEFKTPINAIEGYASLLQDHQQSDEEQAQYVEKILFNTRRLSSLVGNILLLSKLENQSIQPRTETYRLDEQIRQAIVALESKWSEKNIDMDVDLELVDFCGYEGLMYHVFSNLIDNAIKFDPQDGMVKMRLKLREGDAVFTIEDDGPGIKPEDTERIFGKFYQSETSHVSEGNGLGLALVRRIVDMHGGKVTVQNLPVTGCRFTVRLPMNKS